MDIFAVVGIITSFFNDPYSFFNKMIKGKLGELIAKYYSLDLLLQFNEFANASTILKPDALINILKLSTQQERDQLLKELEELNKSQREQAISQMDLSSSKIKLSSSWVQFGAYQQYPKSTNGALTIWVQSDKDPKQRWYGPYTYPNIPNSIWLEMTRARGKNGTGAGSVMWNTFLHNWLPSQLREFINKNKDIMNEQSLRENQQLINDLTTSFARTKKGQSIRASLNVGKGKYKDETKAIKRQYQDSLIQQKQGIRKHYSQKFKDLKGEINQNYRDAVKQQKAEFEAFKQEKLKGLPPFIQRYVKKEWNKQQKSKKTGSTLNNPLNTFSSNASNYSPFAPSSIAKKLGNSYIKPIKKEVNNVKPSFTIKKPKNPITNNPIYKKRKKIGTIGAIAYATTKYINAETKKNNEATNKKGSR